MYEDWNKEKSANRPSKSSTYDSIRRDALLDGHGPKPPDGDYAFSEVWLPDAELAKRVLLSSLRRGPWKLIRDSERHTDVLFNLVDDPGERRNVAAENPELVDRLERRLRSWKERLTPMPRPARPDSPLTEEQRKRLRALGYLN